MATKNIGNKGFAQNTKRCWNCHTHLPLHVKKCSYCGSSVLEVNEHGIAGKPFDWKSYVWSLATIAILCGFIWWAFLRDG